MAALGSRSLADVRPCLRSDTDEPGECFKGGLGAGPDATNVTVLPVVVLGATDRLVCEVFDRPRDSKDCGAFGGLRWEAERSMPGVRAPGVRAGGVGAGRKDVGPGEVIGAFETGGKVFVGGGGAAR